MSRWQLGPVLRSIRGHRAAAVLVAVQFGVGLAITILAALIADYFTAARHAPPISIERDLVIVELQQSSRVKRPARNLVEMLAGASDVVAVTSIADLPLHILERDLDDVRLIDNVRAPVTRVSDFAVGENIARVAGLAVVAGTDFDGSHLPGCGLSERCISMPATETSAIVTASLAEELWPGRSAVGMRFHSRTHGKAIVVGVVASTRTYLFGSSERTVLYAADPGASRHVLVIRAQAGQSEQLQAALPERLRVFGGHAIVTPALDHLRHMTSPVNAVLAILAIIVGSIVVVVLIGSMGLTYFLVASRTREIGLRRAMGATSRDVVRYFLVENMILTFAGTLIGLAIVAIVMPRMFYEQADLAVRWWLIAITIAAVTGLDLLATLIPARKAAAVPPVVASRTV